MLDVVPPGQNGARRGGARQAKSLPKPSVVELDWRLPARLRRPVKAELARQRRRKRQRESIVHFERRALYSEGSQKLETRNQKLAHPRVGVEQHTGDVYQSGRPTLAAAVPPYAGSFLKRSANVVREERRSSARPASPAGPARNVVPTSAALSALSGERDVPYRWKASSASAAPKARIAPPRRRFALPLHLSVWPFRSGEKEAVPTSKKKAQNNG